VKITNIEPWLVASDSSPWGEYFFLRVSTDEEIVGWGEITTTSNMANRAVADIIKRLNELLVGENPLDIERLWNKTFRSFTYMGTRGATSHVVSGIDIALWDIRGKVMGQPVYELLGGKVRESIPLYTHPDQTGWYGENWRERVAEEVKAIVDSGHTALKFDPFPHLDSPDDRNTGYLSGEMSKHGQQIAAKITAVAREVAGPEIEILIDAHGRFNVPTAIRLCKSLEDAGQIDWFEEPVPVESYHALSQVREKVNTAISVGERLHTRWEFVPIFEKELADYIMPDVTWTGGISELKKIATMAEAYYIPVSPHDASGPINVVAGGHVMLTVPNCYRVETHRWDLSQYNVFIDKPLDNTDGALHLSDTPGLGLEMNMDYLSKNRVE